MSASFRVYVDESGDEGFAFSDKPGYGSSQWFVLSAVVTRKSTDLETVKLVDHVRGMFGKSERPALHFRKLRHEQRVAFVSEIAKARLRVLSVLVHKPSIQEPETFQQRYVLYRYASRYLLERVSWLCRDHRAADDAGDGSAEVVFSNRAGMSYEELREYLDLLQEQTGLFDVRIDWNVIRRAQVRAEVHDRMMGLQIADAVASGLFFAVQRNPFGFTEPRYAQTLKPVVYHDRGRYFGYGLKFWPRDASALVNSERGLEWLKGSYSQ